MDAKVESKIILSALATVPLAGGILLVIGGQVFGWLLIILTLIFLIWLWVPRSGSKNKKKDGHK